MYASHVLGWYMMCMSCTWLVHAVYDMYLAGTGLVSHVSIWLVQAMIIYIIWLVEILYLMYLTGSIPCTWLVKPCVICTRLVQVMYMAGTDHVWYVPNWYKPCILGIWLVLPMYDMYMTGTTHVHMYLAVTGHVWYVPGTDCLVSCTWLIQDMSLW